MINKINKILKEFFNPFKLHWVALSEHLHFAGDGNLYYTIKKTKFATCYEYVVQEHEKGHPTRTVFQDFTTLRAAKRKAQAFENERQQKSIEAFRKQRCV